MVVVFKINHFGCLDIIIFVFGRDDEMEGLLEISTDDGFAYLVSRHICRPKTLQTEIVDETNSSQIIYVLLDGGSVGCDEPEQETEPVAFQGP